jgi:spoIIIJ-associated protein
MTANARPEGRQDGGAAAPPPAPVDPAKACASSEEVLKELLSLMLFTDANVAARWDPEQERVKTNVRTSEADRLIGMEGKALESLQFLMTLMVSRRVGSPVAVQVDTNDYWQKKENEILSQVLKGVETVRNTGKPFRMQPMEPPLRRLVHKSLANHPDITTSSEGDGPWRKVVLRLRE